MSMLDKCASEPLLMYPISNESSAVRFFEGSISEIDIAVLLSYTKYLKLSASIVKCIKKRNEKWLYTFLILFCA